MFYLLVVVCLGLLLLHGLEVLCSEYVAVCTLVGSECPHKSPSAARASVSFLEIPCSFSVHMHAMLELKYYRIER